MQHVGKKVLEKEFNYKVEFDKGSQSPNYIVS